MLPLQQAREVPRKIAVCLANVVMTKNRDKDEESDGHEKLNMK